MANVIAVMFSFLLVCQLFHMFTAAVVQWGCAIKGVAVLQSAIERYRLSKSHLTSIHSDLVQVGGHESTRHRHATRCVS